MLFRSKDAADGKLYTGPAWDYDLGFENDYRTYPINNLPDFIYCTNGSAASDAIREMVSKIVKEDPEAKARLIELWEETLSDGNLADLTSYMAESAALLQESQELNFKRWKILNQYTHMNFQALGSYSAELNTVRNYINGRLTRFDELIRR